MGKTLVNAREIRKNLHAHGVVSTGKHNENFGSYNRYLAENRVSNALANARGTRQEITEQRARKPGWQPIPKIRAKR